MIKPVHIAGVGVAVRPRPQQILVVEDNDDQWFLTRWAILRTQPDIQVVRTTDTLDTLGYLASCFYDHRPLPTLILLDLYLPDREEGWALLESIKRHPAFRHIPVIMLSNSASREDIEQSYYLRSTSYLVKPTSYPGWPVSTTSGITGWNRLRCPRPKTPGNRVGGPGC